MKMDEDEELEEKETTEEDEDYKNRFDDMKFLYWS